jgi:hypothetical protein
VYERDRHHICVPSRLVEYLYYLAIGYSLLAEYLGVDVPLLAAVMTIVIAGSCYWRLGSNAIVVLRPVLYLLACIGTFIAVQVIFHGLSLLSDHVLRSTVLWACSIVIVQSLSLRSGFLMRCSVVILLMGCVALPSLTLWGGSSVQRAAAGIVLGGNLANSNGLGAWFGFCFVALALFGLDTRKVSNRVLCWSAATVCLVVASLSVSRGALIASAIAVTVGFRDIFKRGFWPLLLLIILGAVVMESETFDLVLARYETRGLEDTGRLGLWPPVVGRIVASPVVGVGVQNIATYIPESRRAITTPHNAFLFFALSSGVVPFALWTMFWLRAAGRSFSPGQPTAHARFQLPFLLYLLVMFTLGDINNDPWVHLATAVAAGPVVVRRSPPAGGIRTTAAIGNRRREEALPVAQSRSRT